MASRIENQRRRSKLFVPIVAGSLAAISLLLAYESRAGFKMASLGSHGRTSAGNVLLDLVPRPDGSFGIYAQHHRFVLDGPAESFRLMDGAAYRIVAKLYGSHKTGGLYYSEKYLLRLDRIHQFYRCEDSCLHDQELMVMALQGESWEGADIPVDAWIKAVSPLADELGYTLTNHSDQWTQLELRRSTWSLNPWPFVYAGVASVVVAMIARLLLVLHRRPPDGHCSCGYDLRGLLDGSPCPECGLDRSAPQHQEVRP